MAVELDETYRHRSGAVLVTASVQLIIEPGTQAAAARVDCVANVPGLQAE